MSLALVDWKRRSFDPAFCASGVPGQAQYLAAVNEIQGLVGGEQTLIFTDFIDAARRLNGGLEQMSIPPVRLAQVRERIDNLEALVGTHQLSIAAAHALLEDLRSDGLFPHPQESPREVVRRLKTLIGESSALPPPGTALFQGATAFRARSQAPGTIFMASAPAQRAASLDLVPAREPSTTAPEIVDGSGESSVVETPLPLVDEETGRLLIQGQMRRGKKTVEGAVVSDYFLQEIIGRGGNAIVFKGIEVGTQRTVAIKIVTMGSPAQRARRLELFENERRLQGSVESEEIVRVYATGKTITDEPFIVMEYLPGGSLADLIDDVEKGFVAFDLEKFIGFGLQAVVDVVEAHRRGIIHRDIKPENFFFQEGRRRLKLGDLGIAIKSETTPTEAQPTFAGTPGFVPPETFFGEADTYRRDVFALGTLLYELLTGKRPFEGGDFAAIMGKILNNTLTPPSEMRPERNIQKALDRIMIKALSRLPQDRYADASEMFFDLATYKAQELEEEAARLYPRNSGGTLPDESRIRRSRWKSLLQEALREYKKIYDLYPSDAIKEKMVELNFILYHWADQSGDDDLVTLTRSEILSLSPVGREAGWVQKPIQVEFLLDEDLPPDIRPTFLITRSSNRHGVIDFDEIAERWDTLFPGPVDFSRGAAYGIQFTAPGFAPVFIPLPVRPGSYTLRIPVYRQEKIPEGFVVVPAGPVAIRERTGSYSELLLKWQQVNHDFAIGPLITNAQWIAFLEKILKTEGLRAIRKLIPGSWKVDASLENVRDTSENPLDPEAPVSSLPYLAARVYLNIMLEGFDARPPTLDEWKRAVRGNDARMWPWGDAAPEHGMAAFRVPGMFERKGALGNTTPGIRDLSPFSVLHQEDRRSVPFMVSNLRRFLHVTDTDVERILAAVGMSHLAKEMTAAQLMSQYVVTAGEPHDSPAPGNPDIIRLEPINTPGPIGLMPVVPLRRALPTPSVDSLLG